MSRVQPLKHVVVCVKVGRTFLCIFLHVKPKFYKSFNAFIQVATPSV